MKLGIVVRMDKTGLGNQTRNLTYMLKPDKVMAIDSTPFNKNKQFLNTYESFGGVVTRGFPTTAEIRKFLAGLDVVISCETFYNPMFYSYARAAGVKTILQYNYEFLDILKFPDYQKADVYLSPSYWMLNETRKALEGKVPADKIIYLPPPTDNRIYSGVRESNFARPDTRRRFLHIVGKYAANDRNGTTDLLESLKFTESDFELVIKSQSPADVLMYQSEDSRVVFNYGNPDNEAELYDGYDAMILPRRYAGLCLPMNEALMCGMPVIMTDISPNNDILPKKWLVKSKQQGEFMTRTMIPFYSAIHEELAAKIDWLCETDLSREKTDAFELGYNNYSVDALRIKYQEVLNEA